MISLHLQLGLIVLNIGLLFLLLESIRKYKLELKYTLMWLILNSASLVVAIFPKILFFISDNIYIETPVNALYLLSFVVVFIILYSNTVIISQLSNQTRKLTQEVGLLKNELEQVKKTNSGIKKEVSRVFYE
ncbi:DUF2304 domain-containing protein [Paenibacillus sp. JNUCC32]|uniref:DUF2304 domain-containing protein n=1 Tax=Paenibacillus sp. JNUCC32 TaxID=2777984 RepID=UPI001787A1B0|nr:DUF2304 domain-containing protein [Paenibacillus sp. JNUCC-32]QOT09876.1 DUF2304 domain-containing protein [Paenibacillus sp. JNUCC-32]